MSNKSPLRVLDVLKQDPDAFIDFYKYAIKVRVVYCLNLALEIWEYKQLPNFLKPAKEAQIIRNYIDEKAKQKAAIPPKVRDPILARCGSGKDTIFDKAADCASTRVEDAYPEFKNNFKYDGPPRGKKELIAALTQTVKPDVLGACIFLLTGEKARKEDLKSQTLVNEISLRKWLVSGSSLVEVLWKCFVEDSDPDVLSDFFEVLSPTNLNLFLQCALNEGFRDSHLLTELAEPSSETILTEYLISVDPEWWSKVLKKNIETIYKNEIEDDDSIGKSAEKIFQCVKGVVVAYASKDSLPPRIHNLLVSMYQVLDKKHPQISEQQKLLSVATLLISALCVIICSPEKASFDIKIKSTIGTTKFAVVVADCLKCTVDEEENDYINRAADYGDLMKLCKKSLIGNIQQHIESVIKAGSVPVKQQKIEDLTSSSNTYNVATIGHYFASNAPFLLRTFSSEKLDSLFTFLQDNQKQTLSVDGHSVSQLTSKSFEDEAPVFLARPTAPSTYRSARGISDTKSLSRQFSTNENMEAIPRRSMGSRFSPDTPISSLLKHIVSQQLNLSVDPSTFVRLLHDECIFTVGHLQMIPPTELNHIKLPVLLRYTLSQYCNTSLEGGAVGQIGSVPTHAGQRPVSYGVSKEVSSVSTVESDKPFRATFESSGSESENEDAIALNVEERLLIRKSWMALYKRVTEGAKMETTSGHTELVGKVFYSTFWNEFLKNDESARTMFAGRTAKDREEHLNRILAHAMTILEEPSKAREKLSFLGVQHCIWDIRTSSFDSLALAFSNALTAALGSDADQDLCNAWFNLLTSVGSLISDRYEKVKKGYQGEILHKHGNVWKRKGYHLTHDALCLFKSPEAMKEGKRPKFKLLFAHAQDVDTISPEKMGEKFPTDYCFAIFFGTVVKYFCVETYESFRDWVDHITWRIKAYARLRSTEKEGLVQMTSAEMKKGNFKDSKIKFSKPERAAQKVLKYRKHIDSQIKSSSDLSIFDNMLQATIVIDVKGIVQYANETAIKLFELTQVNDMLGKNIKFFMPSEHSESHDSYINNYLTTGKRKVIGIGRDIEIKTSHGTRPVNLTVVDHLQTGTRYFIGTLVPASDHSSSSMSGGGVEEKQNFTLFDKLLQPTIAITKEGIIDYANNAMVNLTGYAKHELISRNITILMTPKDAEIHDEILRKYLRTGVKKVIGNGRSVHLLKKDESILRCILSVTEHFVGTTPFFIGTITEDNDAQSSESYGGGGNDNQFALFDNLLDATISINAVGTILYVNNATIDLTGYSSAELVSKNIICLMNQTYAKKHDAYLRNYQKTGIKTIIGRGREVPVVLKSGSEINVYLTVTEHEIAGTVCFIGTLTQKKDEFTLYDNLLDTTIVINEQGNIQYCNDAIKKLLGWNPQTLIGKNVKTLMPKEYADKHDRYLKNYLTTGKKKIIGTGRTLPFVTRNKTIVSGFLSVVESHVGGKRVFVGTMTSKSVHDEAEEKKLLQASKLILNDIANPAIVITKRGIIKVFNSAAENTLGYKEVDLLNKNIKVLMPEEYAVRHDDILKNYLKTGEKLMIGKGRVLPFLSVDGSVKKLHLTLSEKKDKEGKVIYFIGILTAFLTQANST